MLLTRANAAKNTWFCVEYLGMNRLRYPPVFLKFAKLIRLQGMRGAENILPSQ
jgi:hypothetical protein